MVEGLSMSKLKVRHGEIVPAPRPGDTEQQAYADPNAPAVGRWYWVMERELEGEKVRWLGCVTHVGSNYVELYGPASETSSWDTRVHFNEFEEKCTPEPNAERIIAEKIAFQQQEVGALMGEVYDITKRLAVPLNAGELPAETQALALRTPGTSMSDYKLALTQAKEKLLPELFEQIEKANSTMGVWMKAQLIPLRAQADALKPAIKAIEARIFNVELYAGLVETVERIRDGQPAAIDEKTHLFQRRCYMDEECLARYEVGGMEFKDIGAFDAWLARPENFERILPRPRCIVAFQVRRKTKEREIQSISDFVSFSNLTEADKLTFLYIRNGERLYRLNTEIDFGAQLFPDLDHSQLTGKLYAKVRSNGTVEEVITEAQLLGMREDESQKMREADAKFEREKIEYQEKTKTYVAECQAWRVLRRSSKKKAGPKPTRPPFKPHKDPWAYSRKSDEFSEFAPSNVYYDDVSAWLNEEAARHNRLVLVLQGLLDRSPVLHPHKPFHLWTPEGFNGALSLVFDDSRAFVSGEKPDFEAYRAKLNAALCPGSVTVGQEDYWMRLESKREYERVSRNPNSRRSSLEYWPEKMRPYGNPGPGLLASAEHVTAKGCTYRWTRERQRYKYGAMDDQLGCRLTVPTSALLNVSAYKAGDFKQFFADPRTRAEYLKWAPLLLDAEEYHAGSRELGVPGIYARRHLRTEKRRE
jgi:hypothetical protein